MTAGASDLWTRGRACVIVRVRVTVKSSKDAVEGLFATANGPAISVRVRAVPDSGEANEAVRDVLARWLAVAKSQVTLISGAKSRVKSFAISSGSTAGETRVIAKLDARITSGSLAMSPEN